MLRRTNELRKYCTKCLGHCITCPRQDLIQPRERNFSSDSVTANFSLDKAEGQWVSTMLQEISRSIKLGYVRGRS